MNAHDDWERTESVLGTKDLSSLMNSFVEFVVVNFQLGLGSQLGLCEVGFWVRDDVICMIHH